MRLIFFFFFFKLFNLAFVSMSLSRNDENFSIVCLKTQQVNTEKKIYIFLPQKKREMNQIPPCDPRFDSRCDLYRSFLRDNNYFKAVHTLPTLRRGDRSDAGHNIYRETRLVILKPKIAVSSRKRERKKARKARTRRRNKKSIYI